MDTANEFAEYQYHPTLSGDVLSNTMKFCDTMRKYPRETQMQRAFFFDLTVWGKKRPFIIIYRAISSLYESEWVTDEVINGFCILFNESEEQMAIRYSSYQPCFSCSSFVLKKCEEFLEKESEKGK